MKAYQTSPDLASLSKAIACFMRSIISAKSKYDGLQSGQTVLNTQEQIGRQLFFSDSLNCSKCHTPPLFTNLRFENNGLYAQYADMGRRRITVSFLDDGKFKVPTLRNISKTAPYMHDGSIRTLDDVISHYERGGFNHPRKSALINGFKLSTDERQALVAFLKTLDDQSLATNQALRP